jgi:elongation factor Tu
MNLKKRRNIGTIGHIDHGKTTTTSAITEVISSTYKLSKKLSYDDIDKAPEEKQRGITINQTTVKYETPEVTVIHTDCPGHADYVKNMITGASQMDCAIVVVDASQGPQPQTKEHINLIAKMGTIEQIFVFLNKMDIADPDLAELALEEVLDLLKIYNFKRENIFVFKGSALAALAGDAAYRQVFLDMINKLAELPEPKRKTDQPFLLPVDKSYSIKGRGTVLTGCIEKGIVKLMDNVQLINSNDNTSINTTVTGIEAFKQPLESAQAGDNVGILLRGLENTNDYRGSILCFSGSVKTFKKAIVEILVITEKEGGRHSFIQTGYRPQFFIRTGDFTGSVVLEKNGSGFLHPGDTAKVLIEFEKGVPIEENLNLIVREGGKTVAAAIVEKVFVGTEEDNAYLAGIFETNKIKK